MHQIRFHLLFLCLVLLKCTSHGKLIVVYFRGFEGNAIRQKRLQHVTSQKRSRKSWTLFNQLENAHDSDVRSPNIPLRSLATSNFFPTPWDTEQSKCLSGKSSLKRDKKSRASRLSPVDYSLVDVIDRFIYLQPEKPLATKERTKKPLSYLKSEIKSAALSIQDTGLSLHTFIASISEHMTTARAEKKEIQFTMPQNVGLPSPGIYKLQQCHLNYSG
ncbi:hypothetical protein AVEN_11467-1 [Araneus ventricosus]|uniref:Uncharacterized protein n=1 Tax=Araneus ventricosus TaxID=182803 RepID=A0A4Y2UE76_ARAVE|nr:hypothetical protein AVEN_11467-1 [Araneus ventricosus]